MRTIYIAFDDTEFNDEKVCLEYEATLREREAVMLADMRAFDSEGKELKEHIKEILDRVNYVHFSSERAFDIFNKVNDEEGYDPVNKYCEFTEGDVYIYDEGEWISTTEQIEKYKDILNKFSQMEGK